jgi:2-succinyl-6-hydroxy-2,4-cyclohexadiene-1-carboxylate synthase
VAQGDPVVLIHGFTQTGRSWAGIAGALARAGYAVRTVDAPGHGRSPEPARDLWDAADRIGRAAGSGVYVGYSMGGRLALHLALAEPAHVAGLVLVGATPGIENDAERTARRAADDALADSIVHDGLDPFLERWLAGPLFVTLPAEARGLDERRENTAAGLAASLRTTGTGTQANLWDRLASVSCPVLLVVGELDEKFRALAERMRPRFPRAELAVIAGAGHACHLERPEAFVAAVVGFLADAPGR